MAKKSTVATTPIPPTITFNGKNYLIESLPSDVQDLINLHTAWDRELLQARHEVFKLEAALRGLLPEMDIRLKAVDAVAPIGPDAAN